MTAMVEKVPLQETSTTNSGGRKRPVPKGCTYDIPKTHGVNELKTNRVLQSIAEERVGRRLGSSRVLNSYWVPQDASYKYFEVILATPTKMPSIVSLRLSGSAISRGISKGYIYSQTFGGSRRAAWKCKNRLNMQRKR